MSSRIVPKIVAFPLFTSTRRILGLLVVVSGLFVSLPESPLGGRVVGLAGLGGNVAQAQAWLENREGKEGPGFRTGNIEWHPGLGVEAGYDSNLYLSPSGQHVDSMILRVTPHLDISTLSRERRDSLDDGAAANVERKVAFRLGLAAPFYHYFHATHRTNVAAQGDLNLTIRPDGRFSFSIDNKYRRNIRPFAFDGAGTYAFHRNVSGAVLKLATPGEVFTARIGYDFIFNIFEDAAFAYLNNVANRGSFEMLWQFFPKTLLFFRSDVTHQGYYGFNPENLHHPSYMVRLADNTRVNAVVGMNGAFTPKVSLLAEIGYGAAFILRAPELSEVETVVGRAQLTLTPREALTVKFGYDRGIHPSFSGLYYTLDRGLFDIEAILARRFLLGFTFWAGYLSSGTVLNAYGGPLDLSGRTDRTDVVVDGKLRAEYRIRDWIAITASAGVTWDKTGFQYNRFVITPLLPVPSSFVKYEAFLGCRVFY